MEILKDICATPWKNGYYKSKICPFMIHLVDGEKVLRYNISGKPRNLFDPFFNCKWKYGDFGYADDAIQKVTGETRYSVKMNVPLLGDTVNLYAFLSEKGTCLTYLGLDRNVHVLRWMSRDQFKSLADSGDPYDAPPSHYKLQPEYEIGKLLWITGAPGLGKSTSGMQLSRNDGFVYYEADTFMNHLNPYLPSGVDEPTCASFKQNFLKCVPQKRIDDVANGLPAFMGMLNGKKYDFQKLCTYYTALCENISIEQKRVGGNWAVAQAVPSRRLRDHIRTQLGPNLLFIVLNMKKEDQLERIKGRPGAGTLIINILTKCYDQFELADVGETNAINVFLTRSMTRDAVVEKIMEKIKEYEQ